MELKAVTPRMKIYTVPPNMNPLHGVESVVTASDGHEVSVEENPLHGVESQRLRLSHRIGMLMNPLHGVERG